MSGREEKDYEVLAEGGRDISLAGRGGWISSMTTRTRAGTRDSKEDRFDHNDNDDNIVVFFSCTNKPHGLTHFWQGEGGI